MEKTNTRLTILDSLRGLSAIGVVFFGITSISFFPMPELSPTIPSLSYSYGFMLMVGFWLIYFLFYPVLFSATPTNKKLKII